MKITGKISFQQGGKKLEAVLDSKLKWQCTNKDILKYLQIKFDPISNYGSVAVGTPGFAALHDAAKALQGKVIVKPKKKTKPSKDDGKQQQKIY